MQPKWKKVGTIGDINFSVYGGGIVRVDETGVYPPELEYVQVMPENDTYVYRFPLENLKLSPSGRLIHARYDDTWSHPIEAYTEWFDDSLGDIAAYVGISQSELVDALLSDNPMARASAWESIGQYHGFENLDGYPLHLSESETEERYKND